MPSIPLHLQLQWPLQGVGDLKDLHRSMQSKALLGQIYSFVTGHSTCLLDLTTELSDRKIHNQYYAGIRTVPINPLREVREGLVILIVISTLYNRVP